jgi:predicted nuclease of predicted toxin-antitoxin system
VKLKLDENLGKRGYTLLQAAGHDVMTVPEQNLTSTSDVDLIQMCQVEQRCLVTLDLDFSNPLRFNPREYSGIAVLRLPNKPTPQDLEDAIKTLISWAEASWFLDYDSARLQAMTQAVIASIVGRASILEALSVAGL